MKRTIYFITIILSYSQNAKKRQAFSLIWTYTLTGNMHASPHKILKKLLYFFLIVFSAEQKIHESLGWDSEENPVKHAEGLWRPVGANT